MQKVTDPALLSQLNGTTQQAPVQPSTPGIIMGRPKAPSPAEQQRLDMEAERLRMSQRDQALQEQQANLTAQNTTLDIQKKQQAAAAGPAGEAAEAERKASSFLKRAMNAEQQYSAIDTDQGQAGVQTPGPRSLVGQALSESAPNLLNSLPSSIGNSPERQRADQAQREFIAAILRYDSGAAIPDAEYIQAAKIYYPQPGDTPDVIQQKAQSRRVAIDGLKDAAGRLGVGVQVPTGQQDNRQQGLTLASGLPNASMGSPDPGLQPNGVQDAATGGLKAVPEFRGMASDVQSMVQQGASADQIVQYVAQRHAAAGFDPPNAERVAFLRQLVADHEARPDIPVSSLAKGWQTLEMVESADNGGSLLGQAADSPVGAAAIGAADAVTGGFLDEISGALGGNTDNARAVMKASQQERPISTIAGNIAGGALLPIGKAASPLSLAKAGAAYGGVYGAGSADGNIGDRLTGGAIGALAGGVSGYAGGKAIGALQARSASRAAAQGERNALLQDFKAQGVDPMAANVGGPASKVATGGAGQAFFSAGSIRNAAERQTGQFGEAVGKNAAQAGSVLPADEAGMLARTAAERYSKQTSQRGSALYDRAYQAAGGEKIVPQSAISEIDAQIARLSQSPDASAASLVKELGAFKKKLEEGVSIVGLRDARTRLSQGVYDGKLRSTADQQVYRNVLDRISTDIQDGLQAAGKDRAAGMFRTADKYWAERVDYIDKVLEPIVGKNRSGEQILQSVESMATGKGGGVARLRDIMRSLSDEERGNVQATIIDRIGRATKGAQGAEGETFSANTFLTNWNGLSQKGKSVLFGNSELRQSLDQLARVAESMKDTGRYTNTSNTGGALGWQALVSTGAYTTGGLPSALLAAGGQYITGKMLASPRFAAWLARAPKKPTAQAAQAYTKRLQSIAAAEPVIAADIGRFSQFLNAANDVSPVGAAAQGQQENN